MREVDSNILLRSLGADVFDRQPVERVSVDGSVPRPLGLVIGGLA